MMRLVTLEAPRDTPSTGRVALITGAAQGIGAAFAERLARDGFDIAIIDLTEPTEVAQRVRDIGREIHVVCGDLSVEEEAEALVGQVIAHTGRVDVLCPNAALHSMMAFEDIPTRYRKLMAVNVDQLFTLSRGVLPGMRERGWGRIVATSSHSFYAGTPGYVDYVASKGAVIGFVRGLAAEVGVHGITVNSIAPGLTRTPTTMSEKNIAGGVFERVAAAQAIKRSIVPGDLVATLSLLCSDGASMITGQTIVIDGGGVYL